MKIVKYLFLLLLLASIAGTVFIATQNGKYDVTEQLTIKAPKDMVYNFVGNLKNWENSGILTKDTTAVYTFSETTTGKGAYANWSTGSVKNLATSPNDSITQTSVLNDREIEVHWTFKDTLTEATTVNLRMKGQLSFMEKAYAVLKGGTDKKVANLINHSLKRVNYMLVNRVNFFEIKVDGVMVKEGTYYIADSTSCKISEMQQKMPGMFAKVNKFVTDNNIATNGKPFTYYYVFDEAKDSTVFMTCIPLEDEILMSEGSEFRAGQIKRFNALKTTLKGDYRHLKKAWDAAFKNIKKNKLEENFELPYLEVYTKGPADTKDTAEWITDIYIPIGSILPEEEETTQVNDSTEVIIEAPAVARPRTVRKKTPTVTPISTQPVSVQPTIALPKRDTTSKKKPVQDTTNQSGLK